MAKIGPKEAQRRALAEASAKPRKGVVANRPNRSRSSGLESPGHDKATPRPTIEAAEASALDASTPRNGQLSVPSLLSGSDNTEAGGASESMIIVPEIGAIPADEVRRAVKAYHAHRARSAAGQRAYKRRKKGQEP